jgi:hypothetical protein
MVEPDRWLDALVGLPAGRFFGIPLTSRPVSATFERSNGAERVGVSGIRCCGAWIGCTCKPPIRSAPNSAAKRLGALSAVSCLLLAANVATAKAQDDPQPPVIPTVPTVAVEVSVSVPGVTLIIQTGTVDISVSTANVDVSVSVSSEDTSSSPEEADAPPPQTTQSDGPTDCCTGEAKQVASPGASAKATQAPRTVAPERRSPPNRAAAHRAPARTVRVPLVAPSRHLLAPKQVPRRTSDRRVAPKARRECCGDVQHRVGAATAKPVARAWPLPDRYAAAQAQPAALPEEHVRDNRLLLQLGVLGAFLYLACLAGWFSATRLKRGRT